MHKHKTLSILITLALFTCAITVATTSANAEFNANTNNATTGIQDLPATLQESLGAGVTIRCVGGNPSGVWTIQTATEIESKNGEEQLQPPTKQGPHLALTVQKWGSCFVTLAAQTFAATLSECRLQIAQTTKGSKPDQPVLGSVQTNCVATIPSIDCVLTLPQTKSNHGLDAIVASNSGTGMEIDFEVTGISYKAPGATCIGISKTGKDGKLKAIGAIAVGQTLV